MSHGLTDNDNMFTVGEAAWHGLRTNFQGPRLTAAEAVTFLDWTVKKEQALRDDQPVDGAFFTVREDTNEVLGVVGRMYSVIQNKWLFKLLEPVIDDGACVYETGGSILGGRKVWALAKLPGEYYVVNDDKIEDYILVTIAHDGSLPFTAMHTSVRVVCQNTLSMAHSMGSEQPIVRIKHMPGYNANIQIAHKILGLSTKASSRLSTFFAEMAVRAMNTAELTSFAKFCFPSAREEQQKEADTRIQELRNKLYLGFEAPINNLEPAYAHTAWSAYNAYTDILDHDSPSRKGTDRQNWSWYGPGQSKRLAAMRWLQSLMGNNALPEPTPEKNDEEYA